MRIRVNYLNGQYSAYSIGIIDDLKDFKNQLESSETFLKVKDDNGDFAFVNKNMITSIYETHNSVH